MKTILNTLDAIAEVADYNRSTGIVPEGQEGQLLIAAALLTVAEAIKADSMVTASKQGDTDSHLVMNLGKGFKLCRCINAAGVPYSYVTDSDGIEIASIETAREHDLISRFHEVYLD